MTRKRSQTVIEDNFIETIQDVDRRIAPKIYCSLMKDVDKLRIVLQCPREAHKPMIMQMIFNSSD